jgi:dolichol-phosphate mannosyltransferase
VAAFRGDASLDAVRALAETAAELAHDSEVVLVAADLSDHSALALKHLVETLPDSACLFLAGPADLQTLLLAGVDNAVGDYVFICEARESDAAALRALAPAMAEGVDIATAFDPAYEAPATIYAAGRRTFMRLFGQLAGYELAADGEHAQLMSRPAALFKATQPAAELILRARRVGAGFPARVIEAPMARGGEPAERGLFQGLTRALTSTLAVTAAPLRLASFMALLSGAFSVLYALYVVVIYLLAPNVERGWPTLSMQIAVMSFFFSVVLFLIAEYVIQIYRMTATRARRAPPVREIRSPLTRRSGRLNVIDAEGRFQFGAPANLDRV